MKKKKKCAVKCQNIVVPFLINDSYCGTNDDNANRNHLLIYRGLRIASGDVHEREDGDLGEPDDDDKKNKSLDDLLANSRLPISYRRDIGVISMVCEMKSSKLII